MKYDYLVVGSGLYGAVFAHEAKKKGKTCLVIDKRPHIGGNIYCENIEGSGCNMEECCGLGLHQSVRRVQ